MNGTWPGEEEGNVRTLEGGGRMELGLGDGRGEGYGPRQGDTVILGLSGTRNYK